MPLFFYSAATKQGKTVRGKLNAPNELELQARLDAQQLMLLGYRVQKNAKGLGFSRVQTKDVIMFCVHLEQLDKAGVPLLDALKDMRDSADKVAFKDLMSEVYENVKGGDLLSAALAKRSDVFNNVFVGLVAAGEQTGNMSDALHHLGHHLKWNMELKRKVKKAITYPIVLLVIMAGVVSMMMLFVVPELVEFLTSQGFDLPIHTRALIATSSFFEKYWYFILLTPIVLVILCIILYRFSNRVRFIMDGVLLKMPFLGKVSQKINLARFAHFFAITFNSGIGVLDCLKTARNVVGNHVIKQSITDITKEVSDGSSLTGAIENTGHFPSLVVRMFKVGEDSGNVSGALENITYFYDQEVEDAVDRLIGAIQPALTIILGAVMLWVVSAVFGPLYDSFSKLNF